MSSLKDLDTHFAFGKNWASYASHITEAQIEEAKKGVLSIISQESIQDQIILDIGCGSGLSSLAFLR